MAAITSSIRLTVPKIVSDLEFLGSFNLLVNLWHLPYVTLLQYNPFDREYCSSEYHLLQKDTKPVHSSVLFMAKVTQNPKFNVVKSINTGNILYVKEVLIGFHFIGNT